MEETISGIAVISITLFTGLYLMSWVVGSCFGWEFVPRFMRWFFKKDKKK